MAEDSELQIRWGFQDTCTCEIFFLRLNKKYYRGLSFELSCQGSSNEGSLGMIIQRNIENYLLIISYPILSGTLWIAWIFMEYLWKVWKSNVYLSLFSSSSLSLSGRKLVSTSGFLPARNENRFCMGRQQHCHKCNIHVSIKHILRCITFAMASDGS